MNFPMFFKFLCSILFGRLRFLKIQFPELANFQPLNEQLAMLLENQFATEESCTPADTVLVNAKRQMYNSRELCLFDLLKIRDVLEQFVNNDDLDEKLRNVSSSLLTCLRNFTTK